MLLGCGLIPLAMLGGATACSSSTTEEAPPAAPCDVRIEQFKELMVVEESVLRDPRSSNERKGPWSFAHVVESMAPPGTDVSAFLNAWLEDWANTQQMNGFKVDREPELRATQLRAQLLCPWLRQTPTNNCTETCSSCDGRKLDLTKAPFRLIAIVNRMDLGPRPGTESPSGEGRLVFGLTAGPGDDPASKSLALGLIAEYALPTSLTTAQWADAWHHLGTHPDFGEAYMQDLESVTERFVKRNASPERQNGSALAQIRTNESAFNWIWQLRQFTLDSAGDLRLSPVTNTPGEPLNSSDVLGTFVRENAEKILKDEHVLPAALRAGAADQLLYRWNVPGVDEKTRFAFARGTCNGCHTSENTPIDTAFHISPYRRGPEKLSSFVYEPASRKDELTKREVHMRSILCGTGATP